MDFQQVTKGSARSSTEILVWLLANKPRAPGSLGPPLPRRVCLRPSGFFPRTLMSLALAEEQLKEEAGAQEAEEAGQPGATRSLDSA